MVSRCDLIGGGSLGEGSQAYHTESRMVGTLVWLFEQSPVIHLWAQWRPQAEGRERSQCEHRRFPGPQRSTALTQL